MEEYISDYKKQITVYSDVHYENILAYTSIRESKKELIKLYWLVNDSRELVSDVSYIDTNNNGLIDSIEWIVPSLSNHTYEVIIEISKAEHLDKNHSFISDIYDDVKALDDVWSEPIYHNEYVRVTFERNLTSDRDITVYARNTPQLNTKVEVYYFNSTEKITEFPIITEEKYYKVYLTGMSGSHDTFDLRIKNLDNNEYAYLEFDHIIDPANTTIFNDGFETDITTNWTVTWTVAGEEWIRDNDITSQEGSWHAHLTKKYDPSELISKAVDTSGAQAVYVEFYYMDDDCDIGDLLVYFNDSLGNWDTMVDLSNIGTDDVWLPYTISTTDSQYFHSGFAVRFYNPVALAATENFWVDIVKIIKEEIVNTAPSVSSATITPTTAYTNNSLLCNATITDPNADTLTAYFKWYYNNTLNETGSLSPITNNTNTLISTLGYGNTTKGDEWICEITPYDETVNGTDLNSSIKTISNIAPAQPSLIYPDNNAYINSITMNWSASSDADDDTVYYYVLVNGTQACYTSDLNCSYSPASDSYYQWNVTPFDKTVNGTTSISRYYTYDPTSPQYSNVGKNDSTVKINDVVKLYAQWSDSLAGLSYYIFSWNHSGTMNNDSAISLTEWSNITKTITATGNPQIDWIIYANDTAGNWNNTETQSFTVEAENTAPVITDISDIPAQSITEAGISYVEFFVLASDADEVDNLDDASLNATFTMAGEETRFNSSCLWVSDINTTTANYTCTIGIWYWDGAGTWDVNTTILDLSSAQSAPYGEIFTLQETTAMVMSPTALTWPSISLTDTNVLSDSDPITVNNTANKDIVDGYVNVTAIDLQGQETTTDYIYAGNFTVNVNDACEGTVMANNTAIAVSGATITAGNNSAGQGQEDLYFCLEEIPPAISSQTYSTTGLGSWIISVS